MAGYHRDTTYLVCRRDFLRWSSSQPSASVLHTDMHAHRSLPKTVWFCKWERGTFVDGFGQHLAITGPENLDEK
ncbi:hypothetical protein GCM10010255_62700 [Streptomyces coeruleofuscus]|uniref:Uncharacterized protein n=1 Tax=Streptomyces coeruleofuscus TaxID=66879 RepID=A0ABN3IY98_9ACTN